MLDLHEEKSFAQWRPLKKLYKNSRPTTYDFPHPGGHQNAIWTHISNLTERTYRKLDNEQLAHINNCSCLRLEGDGVVPVQDANDYLLPWQRELLEKRAPFRRQPDNFPQTNLFHLSELPDAQVELYKDFSGLTLFTIFNKFPKEIRLMIWKLALANEPHRNIIVERLGTMWALDTKVPFYAPERLDMLGNPVNRFYSKSTSPAILQVDPESRNFALETYIQLFPNRALCANPVFFNPDVDHITFRYMDYLDGGWFLRSISEEQAKIFNKIKSLALSRRGSRFPQQARNRGLGWKTAPLGFMLKYFRGLDSVTLFTETFYVPEYLKSHGEGGYARVLYLRRDAEMDAEEKLCFDNIALWLEAIKSEDPTFKIPKFNRQKLHRIPKMPLYSSEEWPST